MEKYHLEPNNLKEENHTIQQILYNNGYDVINATKALKKKKSNTAKKDKDKKIHWAKFTYIGKETRVITKAFRNTNVSISFCANNTIGNLLTARRHNTKGKYDNSGVYQLTCPTCKEKYIGQTGRSFKTRFHEHFRDFKFRNRKSSFAQHLLDNGHSIGPIEDIMETIHITKKGQLMDSMERVYIYREGQIENQINDRLTVKPNIIFDVIVRNDPHSTKQQLLPQANVYNSVHSTRSSTTEGLQSITAKQNIRSNSNPDTQNQVGNNHPAS
jgi:hypothetical protein